MPECNNVRSSTLGLFDLYISGSVANGDVITDGEEHVHYDYYLNDGIYTSLLDHLYEPPTSPEPLEVLLNWGKPCMNMQNSFLGTEIVRYMGTALDGTL